MADLNNNNPNITYFAETDFRGRKTRFGIKTKDRARHVYVIGKTGMGKSTMLENMAIQDIIEGNGIGFLDPHGGSAEALLTYVPENRIKDVVYFAPFDLEYPISFNIMEDVGKDHRHLVADGLMSVFKKIWEDAWSARMEYILSNTILALLEYPESTLLGVNRMLSDKNYRQKVVANVTDPSVKSFWVDEFAKYTERFAAEATPAIQNKIGQFTSNPLIRNIIGQPKSSFNLREVMDEKKILIVNLSKGRVGEQNAKLLGGMLMTKIYLAAMSRADNTQLELSKAPPFFLFVDEFQSVVNESFSDILSEARKYKLNLTIAHQYVDQMPEEVRSAVFGNVGTLISFRVGPFDAEILEKVFSPKFVIEDLVNLGFAQIYLTLMIDGVGSPPFSAVTMPPIANVFPSYKDRILESSREQFAKSRDKVEEEINRWHEDQRIVTDSGSKSASIISSKTNSSSKSSAKFSPTANRSTIPPPPPSKIIIPEVIKEAVAVAHEAKTQVVKTPPPIKSVEEIHDKPISSAVNINPVSSEFKRSENSVDREKNKEELKSIIGQASRPGEKKLSLSSLMQRKNQGGATANKDELRQALSELVKQIPKKEEQKISKSVKIGEENNNKETSKQVKSEIPENVLRKMLEVNDEKSL